MIRRVLMVSLTLASISATVAGAIGFGSPVHEWVRVGDGIDLHVRWSDGLLRFLVFRSDRPLTYKCSERQLHIGTDGTGSVYSIRFVPPSELRYLRRRGNPLPAFAWNRSTNWPGPLPGSSIATITNGFVRMPAWIPPVVFLVYPLSVLTRDWFASRKRRPGDCKSCGYDLTGNHSGRCPECGQSL